MTNTDPLKGSGLSADTKGNAFASIPDNARVVGLPMDQMALLVMVGRDGQATVGGTVPKSEIPGILRRLADAYAAAPKGE